MTLVALLYGVAALWLATYGANALFLTALFLRRGHTEKAPPPVADRDLPRVTVQLPLYNEKHVATRLIDAVCAFRYPPDRLHIQVLDDSVDETVELIARRVRLWQARGVSICHKRRPDRTDYKAGALRRGLEDAHGEFIAIFDADFVPSPEWLRETMRHFCQPGSERLGMVQTRWSHLNEGFSPLTRAQALALDGHFTVEQEARASSGLLFNFNGTAGVWRRACIEDAGGWRGDSLCEDLDLSYRAQLAGWRLAYDGGVAAAAEIPAQIASYKRQQYRWAKGSIQVARLLLGEVLCGNLTLLQKMQAVLHLTAYLMHPLLVILLLLTLPILLWGWPAAFASHDDLLAWLSAASLGSPLLYAVAQHSLNRKGWWRRYRWMPLLALLGSGVALSNSRAVFEGLVGIGGRDFLRTPKFGIEGRTGSWERSSYALGVDWTTVGEILLALYALLGCMVAASHGRWLAIPFLGLYVLAFGWVAFLSITQRRRKRDVGRKGKARRLGWLER